MEETEAELVRGVTLDIQNAKSHLVQAMIAARMAGLPQDDIDRLAIAVAKTDALLARGIRMKRINQPQRDTESVIMTGEWKPISEAPKDGSPIWVWLFDSGIRAVWWDAASEEWLEVRDEDQDWAPRWWMPFDAIPAPPMSSSGRTPPPSA